LTADPAPRIVAGMVLDIRPAHLSDPAVRELVAYHQRDMLAISPPGTSFALDESGLSGPGITLLGAWRGQVLVGIGAMLNLFAGRLARIIDRSRDLQELFKSTTGVDHDLVVSELGDLQLRIKIVNSAIFLSVISAIIACGLIGLLFIMEMTGANLSLAIAGAFVVAISLLSLALVQFLREVRIGIRDFMIREEYLERTDKVK